MSKYIGKKNDFALNMIGLAEQVIRGTLSGLTEQVIKGTPVDEGFLINNWQSQLNSMPTDKVESSDKSGSASTESADAAIAKLVIGDTFYFVNNLPYAVPIEYGHSTEKAPQGMLRVALIDTGRHIIEARRNWRYSTI
jgi:hypothetical protein